MIPLYFFLELFRVRFTRHWYQPADPFHPLPFLPLPNQPIPCQTQYTAERGWCFRGEGSTRCNTQVIYRKEEQEERRQEAAGERVSVKNLISSSQTSSSLKGLGIIASDLKQNTGFSSCCNHNYEPLGQSGIPWLLQADRLSRYLWLKFKIRNFKNRFPNVFYNTTV